MKTSTIIKSAILTTDPHWQPPIPTDTFYPISQGRKRGRRISQRVQSSVIGKDQVLQSLNVDKNQLTKSLSIGTDQVVQSSHNDEAQTMQSSHKDMTQMMQSPHKDMAKTMQSSNKDMVQVMQSSHKDMEQVVKSLCVDKDQVDEIDSEINFDSHIDNDIDNGYEASISVMNDMSSIGSNYIHSSVSNAFPTPKVSTKFPGVSSTPRNDSESQFFNPFAGPKLGSLSVKDDIQFCFGFDEPDEDLNIGVSPMKKVSNLKHLHAVAMSMHSNVEEIDPLPTRFATSRFRRPQQMAVKQYKSNLKKHSTKEKKDISYDQVTNEANSSLFEDINEELQEDPQTLKENSFVSNLSKDKSTDAPDTTQNIILEVKPPFNAISPERSFYKVYYFYFKIKINFKFYIEFIKDHCTCFNIFVLTRFSHWGKTHLLNYK